MGAPMSDRKLTIKSPYSGEVAGVVDLASRADVERAIESALGAGPAPSRYERSQILERARAGLEGRREEFARLITSESGLAIGEARYEVGRALDVLRFSAIEALKDDGQIFSCDVS